MIERERLGIGVKLFSRGSGGKRESIVRDNQNLPDLPPKVKMLRLLNEKGTKKYKKCPEKLIS